MAIYCSQNLPDYIKNTEAYKNGELTKALEDAFLGFDASIASKEVMDILKELAGEALRYEYVILCMFYITFF